MMLFSLSVEIFIIVVFVYCPYNIRGFQGDDSNLVEVLSTEYSARTFYRLLHEAHLSNKLKEKGPFTVLVPTNEAFNILKGSFLNEVRNDIGKLRALIQGHILPGILFFSNLKDGASLVSLLGDKIFFTVTRRGVSINGSFVSVADIRASNGVIHIIDRVLVYEGGHGFGNEVESITDKIQSPDFRILRNLLLEGRLFDVLSNGGPFTLFAATDKAFDEVNPLFLNRMRNDQNFLRSVLLQHIVPHKVYFPDYLRTEFVTSLNGKVLWLSSGRGSHQVNGSLVLKKDVMANNGVVHVIENVLLPPEGERIMYPQKVEGHLSSANLWAALKLNNLHALHRIIDHVTLTQIFTLDGPFTIFAPTDFALNSLDEIVTEKLSQDSNLLREVVLQHVVRGLVTNYELERGWEGFALNGQNLYSTLLGKEISVNGATILSTNIRARNGIIHIIDKVILSPSAQAYVPLLRQLDDRGLTVFKKMFTGSGLPNAYFSEGPFTTLIPTNDAFTSLNPTLRSRLESDPEFLRRVLLYHMIPGLKLPDHFEHHRTLPTALGGPFKLRVDQNPLRMNGVKVHPALLNGTNGIVYSVDDVLIPPYPIYNRNSTINNIQDIFERPSFDGLNMMNNLMRQANLKYLLEYNSNPYTMFMPSDSAFMKIDPKTKIRLSQDSDFLRDFILRHVIPGRLSLEDLAKNHHVSSISGLPIRVRLNHRIPSVNGARFLEQDIAVRNGLVNVLDRILVPPTGDLAETLSSLSDVSTIAKIWDSYGLLNVLKNGTDVTLFAPKNEAFFDRLNRPLTISPEGAEHLLKRHLLYDLDGPCYASDLCWKEVIFADGTKAITGIDKEGRITLYPGSRPVHIVRENIESKNGVLHVIDKVL